MRFRYISDLQLEKALTRAPTVTPAFDIPLFLAGDIGNIKKPNYEQFLGAAAENSKHVFMVTGNHEYGRAREEPAFQETDARVAKLVAKIGNITLLNQRAVEYEGRLLIGATLWSHVPGLDTRNARHKLDVEFVDTALELAASRGQEAVVMTHYLPTYRLILPYFKSHYIWKDKLASWASHSDALIRKPAKVWICGHSHVVLNTEIQGVRFLMNASKTRGFHNFKYYTSRD